jgi:2-methylcitrate dehydratase PrpD
MTRHRVDAQGTIAHRLATHMYATSLADIPREAISAGKRVMLDTLAVAWAGSDAPGSILLRDWAVHEGGAADATLLAFGDRVPAPMAALINGTMAGALDFDCLHEPSVMHCDIAILPAVLAIAERQRASGSDFLASLVLGNDLACRLGLSTNENGGWFYSSLYGGIAAAAASAKLLGLDVEGIRNAMGIALSSTGGSRQANIERSLTKRMQTAFAAQTGAQAALLAAAGIAGPAAILEGEAGIWQLCEAGDPEPVLAGLGEYYTNAEISLKKYPSCACNHAAIEAAIRIVRTRKLRPEQVAHARVVITPYMNRIVGGVFKPGNTPQIDAQFNISYSIAAALLRGRLGIDEIQPSAILDAAVAPMIERIEVVIDESLNSLLEPATVEVTTIDGSRFREVVDKMPGAPEAPLSDAEVEEKFRHCAERGVNPLGEARARALMERVRDIENLEGMHRFFDGMHGKGGASRAA